MTQSFIINNCDGVHLRQPVEGGIGEQNAIQPQFLMPVRIMPDFDIFTDGPATVLAVLNLWIQISQTAGASGDWWHSQHRPKQYRVDHQTVNFLQIFQRQRGAKITVVLPDYTECLIYQ